MASKKLVLLTGSKSGTVFNHLGNQKPQSIKRDNLPSSLNTAMEKLEELWDNGEPFNSISEDVINILTNYVADSYTRENVEKFIMADKDFYTRLYYKYLLIYGDGEY